MISTLIQVISLLVTYLISISLMHMLFLLLHVHVIKALIHVISALIHVIPFLNIHVISTCIYIDTCNIHARPRDIRADAVGQGWLRTFFFIRDPPNNYISLINHPSLFNGAPPRISGLLGEASELQEIETAFLLMFLVHLHQKIRCGIGRLKKN